MAEPKRLPEIRVLLSRVSPGESAIPLEYPDNLGLRTKLGGEPDWIQGDETPICPSCQQKMTFVAQIDSIEDSNPYNPLRKDPLADKDYMFGDVGMIYVFFCFECCETASVFQCY